MVKHFDLYGMTAAHKTLPLPSYVKVTNLENGRSVTLRVNDRGPFYSDRIIDLSFAAAKKLGYAEKGIARVRVEGIDPYEWWAARGQKVPMAGATYPLANNAKPLRLPSLPQEPEVYTPPAEQHAGAVLPVEIDSKKKRFFTSRWPISPSRSLRQSRRCATAEGQAEYADQCTGVYQFSGAQPASTPSRAHGASTESERG